LDIGVLGYIGIVQHKEHSPEVLSIPPGTPCIYIWQISCEEGRMETGRGSCRVAGFDRIGDETSNFTPGKKKSSLTPWRRALLHKYCTCSATQEIPCRLRSP